MNNLTQLARAASMYRDGYGGVWPLKENWADALVPYLRDRGMLSCPAVPEGAWGIEYNAELSGLSITNRTEPARVPVFFDGKAGWNAVGPITDLDYRHRGRANVAFADGHVEAADKARGAELAHWRDAAQRGH